MKNRPAGEYWPLPLTVPLMPEETAVGFVSRLAARNGFPNMYALYRLFGIDHLKVHGGNQDALAVIARLSGADAEVLATRLFANEKSRFRFGGAPLPVGWCGAVTSKFCPDCVEADIVSQPNLQPSAAAHQRWFWRLAPLRRCPDHGIDLIELPEISPKQSTDFSCCLNRALISRQIETLSIWTSNEM